MKMFTYQGPSPQSVTLVTLGAEGAETSRTEKVLHAGQDVELPEDHEQVVTMEAMGYLVPVAPEAIALARGRQLPPAAPAADKE